SKSAVPFGGRHRLIDFVLSNLMNSDMPSLYVLIQYKAQSLIEHLRLAWRTSGMLRDFFVTVVPPQMRVGAAWYRGTADAVLQNLNLIDDFSADVVAVFGSDHVYRVDVNQMLTFHQEAGADATIAARRALVSMGNYVFSRQPLVDALVADARRSTDHDFGRSIIPEMVPSGRVYAYDFQKNEVPGVKPYEELAYWRDVGTIESYWEAHMDLLGESPRFALDNRLWPIRSSHHAGPAARFVGGDIDNAQVGESSLVKRATIRNSILGRSVWVNEGAVIEDSIVMDHTSVGKGAHLRRAI